MTTVTREHLAGLEMALSELDIDGAAAVKLLGLIGQASAAPEQKPVAWVDPVALASAAPVYDAGFRDGCTEAKRLNTHADPSEVERLREERDSFQRVGIKAMEQLADAQALLRRVQRHGPANIQVGLEGDIDAFLSATAQPADTGCFACACGSTEPHAATLGCIKAAGDAYHGKTAEDQNDE